MFIVTLILLFAVTMLTIFLMNVTNSKAEFVPMAKVDVISSKSFNSTYEYCASQAEDFFIYSSGTCTLLKESPEISTEEIAEKPYNLFVRKGRNINMKDYAFLEIKTVDENFSYSFVVSRLNSLRWFEVTLPDKFDFEIIGKATMMLQYNDIIVPYSTLKNYGNKTVSIAFYR